MKTTMERRLRMSNKSLYNIYKVSLTVMMVMFLLSACTEVDTCYEADHPHRTSVKFDFDWSGTYSNTKPDSMFVLANRVINHWKCALAVSTTTLKGQYIQK